MGNKKDLTPDEDTIEALSAAASALACSETSDALVSAFNQLSKNDRTHIGQTLTANGIDPDRAFDLARGRVKGDDIKVKELTAIAVALDLTMAIEFK